MRIDILTLFPNMMTMFFEESILKRAQKKGLVEVVFHDLHDYSLTRYGSVDDYPYGGAAGMVMAVEPLANCIEGLQKERRYDEVLGLAEAEYAEHPPTKYYRDGYNLFRRMRDFREHHLLFLHDTRVEPDNSLCERKARVFKRRQHAAMAFRSFESLGNVCDGIAAVDNMRVAGKDVFAETSAIFGRHKAAQATSS